MAKASVIENLDCEASAMSCAARVLRVRFAEICELRAAALNPDDIEGVHDMRVATRRLRSALRDFKPYLRKRIPQKRLKFIAATLGIVRDDDVAILALEKLRAQATGEVIEGIERLIEKRRRRREQARVALAEAIREDVLARLQEDFVARLDQAEIIADGKRRRKGGESVSELSFRRVGREIILSRFDELQDLGESLYRPFEENPLHRMRIAAKRLRYALELFTPCWGEPLASLAEEIAGLQTSLGELHDCDVWIADLGKQLLRHGKERITDASGIAVSPARQAAVFLLSHFVKERTKHFRDALARWHRWEINGFAVRLTAHLADSEVDG
ncbi:MAG: CHAD domain-containing protein [Pyrinomonadaceae bacterium]